MQVVNTTAPKPPHSLILKPQIPKGPFDDSEGFVIEDNFTKRVSLGASPEACVSGLSGERPHRKYYDLYKTIGPVEVIKITGMEGPSIPGMEYGPDFSFSKYIEYLESQHPTTNFKNLVSPSSLPEPFRSDWKYAVPDAGSTGEFWSLSPVKVIYLGVYSTITEKVIQEPDIEALRAARLLRLAETLEYIAKSL